VDDIVPALGPRNQLDLGVQTTGVILLPAGSLGRAIMIPRISPRPQKGGQLGELPGLRERIVERVFFTAEKKSLSSFPPPATMEELDEKKGIAQQQRQTVIVGG